MRFSWLGILLLLVGPAALLPRTGAQTPEIQAAVQAKLAPPAAAPKAAPAAPAVDYKDYVFLASDRPVLLRLHLRNGGRPYFAAWDDYMKKLFAHFDRNGDGMLDKAEAERAPNVRFLEIHLQGAIGFPLQGQTVKMAEMDANKDGKVSPAEFAAYYRRQFGPLQLFNNSTRASTDTVTNTFYKLLDTNKDGKLSAEEMAKAPTALQRLDLDEDEMLTAAELSPSRGDNIYAAPVAFTPGMRNAAPEAGFLEVQPGAADGVAKQVLTHYDKDKNGKLSRAEIGLEQALFDKLDANHDGHLDAKELAAFFQRDADLELIARAGKVAAKEGLIASFVRDIGKEFGMAGLQPIRTEVFNPSKRSMPLATKVERRNPSALAFALGDARIELSAGDQTFAQFRNVKQFYVQQFKLADIGKKGVVDRKKAMTVDFLNDIFTIADRDGDDKLTEKELNAYLDLQVEGSGCRMVLGITDEGRSLFDVLDADHDGRLSVRELRTGWSRMKPLARSDSGLSREDISRRLEVSIGQGQQRFRGAVQFRNGMPVRETAGKSAPLWFTKMDRNRDGDLSPREFIGSEEDFRKLDADGDGLISVEEARQYEAKLKKK